MGTEQKIEVIKVVLWLTVIFSILLYKAGYNHGKYGFLNLKPARMGKPKIMYVYIISEPGLFTVGFYAPNGQWHPESDHSDREKAAARVSYLNGNN